MRGKVNDIIPDPEKYDYSALTEGRTIVQFRDNELLFTDLGGRPADDRQKQIIEDARKTQYAGYMSEGAQKRMVRALTLLSQAIKPRWITNPVTGRLQYFKLAMITLTVSDRTNWPAKDAYQKLLRPFLFWLRYTKGCRHYVWKLEYQERGQVHYHLAIPMFIHYRELRDKWNKIQRDAGAMRGYTFRTFKMDPNSTDVTAIGNVKGVAKYMVKYLSKGEDQQKLRRAKIAKTQFKEGKITAEQYKGFINEILGQRDVGGKVWDCSESLNEKYFTVLFQDKAYRPIKEYCLSNPDAMFCGEKFMLLKVDYSQPPPWLAGVMARFRAYLDYIRAGGKNFIHAIG